MSDYLLFNVTSNSYKTRSQQQVDELNLFYFSLLDKLKSSDESGYIPVVTNIIENFTANELELPAIYNLKMRAGRNFRTGKPEPRLIEADFKEEITIENFKDSYLLFGGKKVEIELDNGKIFKGVKFFGIDPSNYIDNSIVKGYELIEFSKEKVKLLDYQFPAYYDISFREIRGRGGVAVFVADSITFLKKSDLFESSNTSSSSSQSTSFAFNS